MAKFLHEYSAASILLSLRDGTASDYKGVCSIFGLDPDHHDSPHGFLINLLERLQGAELIVSDTPVRAFINTPNASIKLSDKWLSIQTVLGLSLRELASVNPQQAMFVQPLFGKPYPTSDINKFDLFVIMPFRSELKPIYDYHIKVVAERLKLKVKRADDFFTAHSIMKDVWEAICLADIIIADCTGRNPNVFYEIGMAHSIGKPVILITQNGDDVPSDLRHIRYIPYEYTPPGMNQFENSLAETIRGLLEDEQPS